MYMFCNMFNDFFMFFLEWTLQYHLPFAAFASALGLLPTGTSCSSICTMPGQGLPLDAAQSFREPKVERQINMFSYFFHFFPFPCSTEPTFSLNHVLYSIHCISILHLHLWSFTKAKVQQAAAAAAAPSRQRISTSSSQHRQVS